MSFDKTKAIDNAMMTVSLVRRAYPETAKSFAKTLIGLFINESERFIQNRSEVPVDELINNAIQKVTAFKNRSHASGKNREKYKVAATALGFDNQETLTHKYRSKTWEELNYTLAWIAKMA